MYPVGKVRYDVLLQAANNEDNFIRLPTKYRNSINFHFFITVFIVPMPETITTLFQSRHIVFPIDIYYALLTGYRPTHTSAPPPLTHSQCYLPFIYLLFIALFVLVQHIRLSNYALSGLKYCEQFLVFILQ